MESGILYQTLLLVTGWLVTLSHGAKKKDKQDCKEIKEEVINFSVGELVIVMNHGDAWTHRAHIISLNLNENAAMIKWERTGKSNFIEITDLKRTWRWKPHKENKRQLNSSILFLSMLVRTGTNNASWQQMRIHQIKFRFRISFTPSKTCQNYVLKEQ